MLVICELYEERAAILEYCANLPRVEAERLARVETGHVMEAAGGTAEFEVQALLPGVDVYRDVANYG